MTLQKVIDYLVELASSGKLKIIFFIILVLVLGSDFLVHREHAVFIWDKIPGWSAFFGFASGVIVIFVVKFVGHLLLRKEGYYD